MYYNVLCVFYLLYTLALYTNIMQCSGYMHTSECRCDITIAHAQDSYSVHMLTKSYCTHGLNTLNKHAHFLAISYNLNVQDIYNTHSNFFGPSTVSIL